MKKPRDLALAVYKLVQERLPQLSFDKIHVLPVRMRDKNAYAILQGTLE